MSRSTRGKPKHPASPQSDIGRIPPHLLPDRDEVMGRAAPSMPHPSRVEKKYRSPKRVGGHAWNDPRYSGRRSVSPVNRGTGNQRVMEAAEGKPCPYGWHTVGSPERGFQTPPPPPPPPPPQVLNQDAEVALMKQQLAIALEQVRGLRDENKTLKAISPRAPVSPHHAIASPSQPLDKFLTNIDEIINHHDRISSRTLDYAYLADEVVVSPKRAEVGSPQKPEVVQLQLQQANDTIAEQRERIAELEKRLGQREQHIDQLTRSLIDLGQHNAKLQAQIRSFINDTSNKSVSPSGGAGLPPEASSPVGRALEAIEAHQSKVRQLDEEVNERFEQVKSAASAVDGAEDFKRVLEAIEEHRERADQIVSLNKQSMGMLKEYYLENARNPWEELAQKLLESGEWVKRHDESLNKTYYYNPRENRVSWDLVEDLQKSRSASPQPLPTSVPMIPIPAPIMPQNRSQSPLRSITTAILTSNREFSPPFTSHLSSPPIPSIPLSIPIPAPIPTYAQYSFGGTG